VADVVAALSVVSDLARGHPPGEAVRACLLATELARRAGLDATRQVEVYYGTLMRFAGCAATSHRAWRSGAGPGRSSAGPGRGPRRARSRGGVIGGPAVATGRADGTRTGCPALADGRSHQAADRRRPGNLAVDGAHAHGDVRAILDLVTDDVDWSTDAAIASAPWYGPRHGKDGVASFFEAIGKTGPVTEFTPLAYAANDQGDVMVFIRYAFTVTATGKHAAMNMHHYWKFRDGKVCYVRSSEDTAQVAAALTP
jgi:ketosteroid isomerase-like protein